MPARFGSPFAPSLPAQLVTAAGVLGADVPLPAATDTLVLTTVSLAVGTWSFDASAELVVTGAAASDAVLYAALGTATATFLGAPAADGELPALASGSLCLSFACLVVVTVAGTLQLRAQATLASTVKQLTTLLGKAATGYAAVKIG